MIRGSRSASSFSRCLTTALCSASLFSEQEIREIRGMTFHDVLVAVTSAEAADLQQEVFFWRDGNCLELKGKEEGLTGSRGEEVV